MDGGKSAGYVHTTRKRKSKMNPILIDVIWVGAIGIALHVLIKARELKSSAVKHNIQFKWMDYFVGDWLSHIISILIFVLWIFFIKRRLHIVSDDFFEVLLGASATVGYSGDQLASKFFSATTKRIEAAIDYKTTLADKASGTESLPTPK